MIGKYYKPTPKNVKKWLLAFKGLIGTLSGVTLINDYPKVAAGILIAGALIDFTINAVFGEEEPKS